MNRTQGFVTALALLIPASVAADGFTPNQSRVAPSPQGAFIYSPAWCYVIDPCLGLLPVQATAGPVASQKKYARATAAPPSSGPLDPALFAKVTRTQSPPARATTDLPPAVVAEFGPYHEIHPVMQKTGSAPVEQISAQFWNQSGRDLNLSVDGQQHLIQRGKMLPLTLGRKFVWRVDNRDAETEQIAPGQIGVEIVIRR